MITIKEIRSKLDQQKGKKSQVEETLASLAIELRKKERSLHRYEKAREIIRIVGLKTQEQLQYHIADITSLALDAVFDDPYELVVDFVQRRNKTECDLYFVRDGNRVDPMEESGVGAVDVAAFALRIAVYSMSRPHSRNVIILDEPFHFLSEDHQERASIMLKELSKKLGLQFIITTHKEGLTSYADKIFEVKKRKRISKII